MKPKLDENLPARLAEILAAHGHGVHTVPDEGLGGRPDADIWHAATGEGRFLLTQDLDFSDTRRYAPGTHPGLLLLRLREPGAGAIVAAVSAIAADLDDWADCFVVVTENKVRVKRP